MSLLERMESQGIRIKKQEEGKPEEELITKEKNSMTITSLETIRNKAHMEVISKINKNTNKNMGDDAINMEVKEIIDDAVELYADDVGRVEKGKLSHEIYNEVVGLGPLEELLDNTEISEIMVNGPNKVYVEKKGKLILTDIKFRDNEHVMNIIDKIVAPIGRHVDEAAPMVDARLSDGSRVNAVINPISLIGPILTIRKFSKSPLTIEDLLGFNSMSYNMAEFLAACVKGKMNIVVSGGTGSGKTTLLNVLSSFIPHNERIVTIEDAAELRLMQDHVITLESRPANLEGKGLISIRDLVRNALRMRPDRIVVGEVRGGETLDMLQAMNTGHDGSMTTAHANSARDLLSRLETMVLMSGMEIPVKAIREQISSAIQIVIQQNRISDGTRKITGISEVIGMEGDVIVTQEIFTYKTDGTINDSGNFVGQFMATGAVPQFIEKIKANGVHVDNNWFAV